MTNALLESWSSFSHALGCRLLKWKKLSSILADGRGWATFLTPSTQYHCSSSRCSAKNSGSISNVPPSCLITSGEIFSTTKSLHDQVRSAWRYRERFVALTLSNIIGSLESRLNCRTLMSQLSGPNTSLGFRKLFSASSRGQWEAIFRTRWPYCCVWLGKRAAGFREPILIRVRETSIGIQWAYNKLDHPAVYVLALMMNMWIWTHARDKAERWT